MELTPMVLSDYPEIAPLWTLRVNLHVAELALLASHPESCEHSYSGPGRSEQEAYALALLHQIDALRVMLSEYLGSVRRLGTRPGRELHTEDLPF